MLIWIFIGIILNYLKLLKGWTLFWFIVCCLLDLCYKSKHIEIEYSKKKGK